MITFVLAFLTSALARMMAFQVSTKRREKRERESAAKRGKTETKNAS
jgi:hypothetical protein